MRRCLLAQPKYGWVPSLQRQTRVRKLVWVSGHQAEILCVLFTYWAPNSNWIVIWAEEGLWSLISLDVKAEKENYAGLRRARILEDVWAKLSEGISGSKISALPKKVQFSFYFSSVNTCLQESDKDVNGVIISPLQSHLKCKHGYVVSLHSPSALSPDL